jgi:nucleotide-binding universal stress UspA family protein
MLGDLDLGLIVVGTHGRTGWKKLLLGSVAEMVVDKASCPVLTVGPRAYRSQLQHFGPKNILLASDASAHSKLAESYAFSLAQKYGSRLTALRVLEDRWGRVIAQASQLEWCGPELRDVVLEKGQTNPLQMLPEIGTRSDLILQAADQTAADLIVLTVPAAHRFADRLRSSNAYRVLCEAPCPVLTVRDE